MTPKDNRAIAEAWVQTSQDGWYPEGANAMAKFMDVHDGFFGVTAQQLAESRDGGLLERASSGSGG